MKDTEVKLEEQKEVLSYFTAEQSWLNKASSFEKLGRLLERGLPSSAQNHLYTTSPPLFLIVTALVTEPPTLSV